MFNYLKLLKKYYALQLKYERLKSLIDNDIWEDEDDENLSAGY